MAKSKRVVRRAKKTTAAAVSLDINRSDGAIKSWLLDWFVKFYKEVDMDSKVGRLPALKKGFDVAKAVKAVNAQAAKQRRFAEQQRSDDMPATLYADIAFSVSPAVLASFRRMCLMFLDLHIEMYIDSGKVESYDEVWAHFFEWASGTCMDQGKMVNGVYRSFLWYETHSYLLLSYGDRKRDPIFKHLNKVVDELYGCYSAFAAGRGCSLARRCPTKTVRHTKTGMCKRGK